jgi:hypothetical protein
MPAIKNEGCGTQKSEFEFEDNIKSDGDGKTLMRDVGEAYLHCGFVGFGYLEHCARL